MDIEEAKLRRGARGFRGVTNEGTVQLATLRVGRDFSTLRDLIGQSHGGARIGKALSDEDLRTGEIHEDTVLGEALRIRGNQIGLGKAGGTVIGGKGFFEGGRELSSIIEIEFLPGLREWNWNQFRRNVTDLGEEMASTLAQKEIMILWDDGTTGRTRTRVSPKGLPGPGPELDKWLTENG